MPKILAIDDKQDNLTTLSAILRNYIPDCTIITAQSGPEGIENAIRELPDTILMDIKMPGMDGYEACKKIKANKATRHIPIAMITAIKTESADISRGLDIGADAFLAKPIDETVLVAQVNTLLRIKKAEDKLRDQRDLLGTVAKERTDELIKSEKSYKVLLETTSEGFWQFNPELKTIEVNPALCKMLGYSAEEMIGKTPFDFADDENQKIFSEQTSKISTTLHRSYEIVLRKKNQETFPVHFNGTTIRDESGKVKSVFAFVTDFTERKQAEEKILKQFQFLQSLIDAIPNPIFYKDAQGIYTGCNKMFEEFVGKRRDEIIGKTVYGVSPNDLAKIYHEKDLELMQQGSTQIYESSVVYADGSIHDVIFHKAVITGKKEIGLIGVILDITERKQAEKEQEKLQDQLYQAQKMESVGRLAGGVAHDYNNALSAIIGFTELAMDDVDPSGMMHDNLKEVLSAAKHATDITRQLLAFARKQTIAPKVLDLNENVESMLKMLRHLIGEDIELAWLPGAGLWPVKIDPSQIDQIMANLCVNARDAIDGVGRITIETASVTFDSEYCTDHTGFVPGEFVMLTVSDNGSGIDKEILDNIFEPFFTTKDVDKGTGLGLATVYGIVKQNSGFINVYSELGKGTSIRICLPRHEGAAVEILDESMEELPQGQGETVLIVEDDLSILKLAQKVLDGLGYTVLTAGTPLKAVRLAEEYADIIHLLVTDVIMPQINGRDLSQRLESFYPDLKCVFMSGYTADVISQHGVLDEGVQFIQKPFSRMALATTVRKTLDE